MMCGTVWNVCIATQMADKALQLNNTLSNMFKVSTADASSKELLLTKRCYAVSLCEGI